MKNLNPQTRKHLRQLIFVLALLVSFSSQATHIMGGELSYKLIDTAIGKYKVTLTVYRDCAGINFGTEYLNINKAGVKSSLPMVFKYKEEVSQICTVPDVAVTPTTNCPSGPIGAIMGVEKWVYELECIIGKNIGYAYVGWTSCCRNHAITTINSPGNQSTWMQALINTDYVNNSVVFANIPFKFLFTNISNTYNPAGVDSFDQKYIQINGKQIIYDSIAYNLYTPFTSEGSSMTDVINLNNGKVSFLSPLNTQNFLYTNGNVNFNPISGELKCTPNIAQTAIYAVAASEYRAVPDASMPSGYKRVLVGHITRDIQFAVINGGTIDRNLNLDSLKNVVKAINSPSYVYTILGKNKNNKIHFSINGLPGANIKYRLISQPQSTDLTNFNSSITGVNTNKLSGIITFDSVVTPNVELYYVLESYECLTSGIKHIKSHTIMINTQGYVSCQMICNVTKSADSLICNADFGVKPYTYNWSNGSTMKSIKAFAPGIYYVTVTDSNGCISKCNYEILSPCVQFKNIKWNFVGGNFNFQCSTPIPPHLFPSYFWTFSNGTTSVVANPSITFIANGIYSAKLIYCLKDSNQNIICCDSIVKSLIVSSCPMPCNLNANFNWTMGSNPGSVQFIDSSTPHTGQMYTYLWSFGNGTYSTQKNPSINYSLPGNYTVCLIVARWLNNSNMFCVDTICKTITITAANPCNRLVPNFNWATSSGSYQFTNTTNMTNFNLVSIQYQISSGTNYSIASPTHTFTTNGNYSVTMTIVLFDILSGVTCTKSITKYINVNTSICGCLKAYNLISKSGMTVNFTNNSTCTDTANTTYLYKFGNGVSSTLANPSYTYPLPGLYRSVMYVTKTLVSATCIDSFVRIIQITTSNPCIDSGYTTYYNASCGAYINPVCGCNGVTYQNSCQAGKSGVKQYTSGPCSNDPDWSKVCGYVYHDLNKDCFKDSNEVGLKSILIKLHGIPARYTYTNNNGFYEFWVPKGTYVVEQIITNKPGLAQMCPSSPNTITVAAMTNPMPCNHNFYDTASACQDLSVTIQRNWNITPGFKSKKTITYKNNSAHNIPNVQIHYRFLAGLTVLNTTTSNYTVSGNILTWNLGTVPAYSTGFKSALFLTPISMPLGTQIIDSVWIEPIGSDCNMANNISTYTDTCVGSWDPNDKTSAQTPSIHPETKTIDYHIRFQNTGTAPAHNVVVEDQIDPKFDFSSLIINGGSHTFQTFYEDNGKIFFEFPNIMLPDSGTDYEASQGFIGYSVKLKDNLLIGTQLKNTAHIFFDFNDAVITNTTIHTIVLKSTSGVQNIGSDMNISVYPNPTADRATMKISLDKSSKVSYSIYDLQGKQVMSNDNQKAGSGEYMQEIDLVQLSKGIYLLNISIDEKVTSVKIVKE